LQEGSFRAGTYDTTIVSRMQEAASGEEGDEADHETFLAALAAVLYRTAAEGGFVGDAGNRTDGSRSPWVVQGRGDWRWQR
jgi:hypothetical protein